MDLKSDIERLKKSIAEKRRCIDSIGKRLDTVIHVRRSNDYLLRAYENLDSLMESSNERALVDRYRSMLDDIGNTIMHNVDDDAEARLRDDRERERGELVRLEERVDALCAMPNAGHLVDALPPEILIMIFIYYMGLSRMCTSSGVGKKKSTPWRVSRRWNSAWKSIPLLTRTTIEYRRMPIEWVARVVRVREATPSTTFTMASGCTLGCTPGGITFDNGVTVPCDSTKNIAWASMEDATIITKSGNAFQAHGKCSAVVVPLMAGLDAGRHGIHYINLNKQVFFYHEVRGDAVHYIIRHGNNDLVFHTGNTHLFAANFKGDHFIIVTRDERCVSYNVFRLDAKITMRHVHAIKNMKMQTPVAIIDSGIIMSTFIHKHTFFDLWAGSSIRSAMHFENCSVDSDGTFFFAIKHGSIWRLG
jgi:hypothetical protein